MYMPPNTAQFPDKSPSTERFHQQAASPNSIKQTAKIDEAMKPCAAIVGTFLFVGITAVSVFVLCRPIVAEFMAFESWRLLRLMITR